MIKPKNISFSFSINLIFKNGVNIPELIATKKELKKMTNLNAKVKIAKLSVL